MVLLIIIPIKWLVHWEYTLFSDKPISTGCSILNHPAIGDPPFMKNLWGVNTHRYGLFPTEEWGMLPPIYGYTDFTGKMIFSMRYPATGTIPRIKKRDVAMVQNQNDRGPQVQDGDSPAPCTLQWLKISQMILEVQW